MRERVNERERERDRERVNERERESVRGTQHMSMPRCSPKPIRILTYAYIPLRTYIHAYTSMCACKQADTHTSKLTHALAHKHLQTCTHAYSCSQACAILLLTHMQTYTLPPYPHRWLWGRWLWWHGLQIQCIHKYILTHSLPTHTGGCRGGGCGGTGCGYDKNTCTYSRTPSLPTQVAAGAAAVVAQAVVTMKTHVHTHTLSPYPHKWLWGRWQWWHRLQIRCIHKYILTHSLPTHTGGCGGGGIGGTGYRYDAFTSTYSHTPSLFAQVAAGVVAVVARAVDTVHKGV
jgi:hypothetical protein